MSDPLTIIHGDALSSLKALESVSVQCVVTSPPYWGLRDYGVEGQLGLEKIPEEYVSKLVEIFREVRRVLRRDGTLWLNLGDSYAGSWGNYGGQNRGNGKQREIVSGSKAPQKSYEGLEAWKPPTANNHSGLKPKDLVGIPWMTAFALRADGWYLRSDIIWSKPNPMPESVTDRPTRAHEYLFLLAKSQQYFYDHEAIKEPAIADHGSGNGYKRDQRLSYDGRGSDKPYISARDNFRRDNSKRAQPQFGQTVGTHRPDRQDTVPSELRNKRSVWEIATRPFAEAHFATFPTHLITPCILAGSKAGDVVLDPFAGSGTTGKVAIELGRKAMLIEPKAEYVEMIKKRCQTTIGLPM